MLSSHRSHAQVRRLRRIDENNARRGFTRRNTAEKIPQLAAFDNMNWPPRAENSLYTGFLQNNHVASSLLRSQRLRGIFWIDSCSFSRRFELCNRVKIFDIVTYPRHITSLASVQSLGMSKRSLHWMLLASCTIGHCLDPNERARSGRKWTARTIIGREPETICVGFRTLEGQPKVRRIIASAVVDSCLNYIVETCILRARHMPSNSLFCDIFATLTQEIDTCPSCRLDRLLFVRIWVFTEG